MLTILKKEFNNFFAGIIGYVVVGLFLLFNGLLLWYFKGNWNIFNIGFADLQAFFEITPWLLMVLIPAITMRMFSDEYTTGTIEILITRPLTAWQVVLGKFLAGLTVVFMSLIPTILYAITISRLALPEKIDIGPIIGAYLGLFSVATIFTSIGLFTSLLFKNQIIAFLSGLVFNFILYFAFEQMSIWDNSLPAFVQKIGVIEHFKSISRGVLDSRDFVYFGTLVFLFLWLTKEKFSSNYFNYKDYIKVFIVFSLISVLGNYLYFRKDLTKDHRFTLSEVSKKITNQLDKKVKVEVYLKGEFPLDFKRLSQATEQYLEEVKSENSNIRFKFIDPIGNEEGLIKKGMQPSRLTVEEEGSVSEKLIFPYALVNYDNKEVVVPLLVNSAEGQEKQLQRSIENLEYAFSNAFAQVNAKKQKSVAVLRSNGTLEDIYLYDFLSSVKEKYNLAPFTLKPSTFASSTQISDDIKKYDALIIPKPTQPFSEEDKLILDQYIMNGGKTLWLIDNVYAEMDSLQQTGDAMFIPRDLGLTDLLFSYGVRINYNLVQDLYSSKIAVATGNVGNQTQFKQFLWRYYPLINPNQKHPITKSVELVNLKFPSSIDTLKNNIKKTILLQSSKLTKTTGLPNIVSLLSLADKVDPNQYQGTQENMGILLEGKFTSAYAYRTKPFVANNFKKEGIDNKMIVISDGDIVANQVHEGQPTSLNVDKWTGQYFGNKEFLLNALDYLLDDSGLLTLRGKTLEIKMLNKQKVESDKGFWQIINIILPLVLLTIFGFGYQWWRKRKYTNF